MRQLPAVFLSGFLACGSAHAQGLLAVRPLPGYICMQLAVSPEQVADPKGGIPILDAPSHSAAVANYAPAVVIVKDPPRSSSDFLQVLRLTGKEGWIEARYSRPWANPYVPNARCVPSLTSDGRPGFGS